MTGDKLASPDYGQACTVPFSAAMLAIEIFFLFCRCSLSRSGNSFFYQFAERILENHTWVWSFTKWFAPTSINKIMWLFYFDLHINFECYSLHVIAYIVLNVIAYVPETSYIWLWCMIIGFQLWISCFGFFVTSVLEYIRFLYIDPVNLLGNLLVG